MSHAPEPVQEDPSASAPSVFIKCFLSGWCLKHGSLQPSILARLLLNANVFRRYGGRIMIMNKDLRPSQRAGARGGQQTRGGGFIYLRLVRGGGEGAGSQGRCPVRPAWKSSLEEHERLFHGTNQLSMHLLCMSSDCLCACARARAPHLYSSASVTFAPPL